MIVVMQAYISKVMKHVNVGHDEVPTAKRSASDGIGAVRHKTAMAVSQAAEEPVAGVASGTQCFHEFDMQVHAVDILTLTKMQKHQQC